MKKKILTLLILLIFTSYFSGLLFPHTAKAEEVAAIFNQIIITQYPSKMTYARGESLDLTDMTVEGYYGDGTSAIITDYVVEGYDSNLVGIQTLFINYQNYIAVFNITVIPAKVTNITVADHSTASLTLIWDSLADITRYEIYSFDDITGTYYLAATTDSNSITLYYVTGTIHSYQICAVGYQTGAEYKSEFSDTFTAATDPDIVTGLTVTGTTSSSVSLTWNEVSGATGYLIYRSPASDDDYSYIGEASSSSYKDKRVASGTSYHYIVNAYTLDQTYMGIDSTSVETSTYPAKVALKYKAGDQKIRFTWAKLTGVSSYDIYIGEDSSGFSLLTTNIGNSNCSYLADGLITGKTYSFYAIAHREYNGVVYDSQASDITLITLEEIKDTSTTAKYFAKSADFKNSWAYKYLTYFSKNINFSRSYVIPGLITTNIGGFSSTSMCPQGITFAEDYLLLTAYDMASQENSVIYVLGRSSKKLLTTLILPTKTHAGGIGYDGFNIWIPTGTKVSSIPFSEIEAAAKKKEPYSYINYSETCNIGITASYVTYYNNKLWLGSYNELQTTNLCSYIIENKDTGPFLTKADTIIIPTRVQGAAFTTKGFLILSRSCQLYQGLRGYMRQLDVYKPTFSKERDGIISLGDYINSVEMPSMNEDITIDGSYLYVNFESAAFDKASYKMDRVCSFKLTSITTGVFTINSR